MGQSRVILALGVCHLSSVSLDSLRLRLLGLRQLEGIQRVRLRLLKAAGEVCQPFILAGGGQGGRLHLVLGQRLCLSQLVLFLGEELGLSTIVHDFNYLLLVLRLR